MTQRKIIFAIQKINSSKQQLNFIEALIKNYHLNISLLKYIFYGCCSTKSAQHKKIKLLIEELISEIEKEPGLKSIISKKSLKHVLPWVAKMDLFFKALKLKEPENTKLLLIESEHVLAILNISAAKISLK